MKHQKIDDLGAVAEIVQFEMPTKMSRRERLERWADVLDQNPGKLNALTRIEYLARGERPEARADNSPLEVAFKDPVLRRDGLGSDRLGDAMAFFGISDRHAHRLFCDCHYSGSMTGPGLAVRLRRLAQGGIRAWFA
jgi:hypothetical protein